MPYSAKITTFSEKQKNFPKNKTNHKKATIVHNSALHISAPKITHKKNRILVDGYLDLLLYEAKKYEPVTHYTENGWYKYTCIETPSFNEAKELLKEIQAIFKDAVIVAFENGTKISITEALNKQK